LSRKYLGSLNICSKGIHYRETVLKVASKLTTRLVFLIGFG
jgi:hypothetical protein